MFGSCLLFVIATLAMEDVAPEEDATCLLALKTAKTAVPVSPQAAHDAWKAQHQALRESTAALFPVPAAGMHPAVSPVSLLSSSLANFRSELEQDPADADAVAAADAEAETEEAGVLPPASDRTPGYNPDDYEEENTDDPFAAGYKGWRSTPPPVHEIENITIGEMNYLDSPYITSNTTEMEKFILEQQESSQACHAKLLEVRRTLDAILSKVNTLSDIVEAHDAIVAGNTQLIEDSVTQKNKNEKAFVDSLKECHKQYGLDLLALEQYRNEIKELEEIANPDVRSSIVFDLNYTAAVLEHEQQIHTQAKREADREKEAAGAAAAAAEAQNTNESATNTDVNIAAADAADSKPVLAQTGAAHPPSIALLSEEKCHKLAANLFQLHARARAGESAAMRATHEELRKRHKITRLGAVERKPYADDQATMDACNGAREELQEKFNDAWFALNRLLENGIKLAKQKKDECEMNADAAHDERQENLDNQIEDSTVNVKGATMAMRQLQGLLDNAKKEVKLLKDHIELLKKDCVVEDGVTEQLVAVRNLIQSLEDCPGANSFKLTVPSESQRGGFEDAVAVHEVTDAGAGLQARKEAEAAAAAGED